MNGDVFELAVGSRQDGFTHPHCVVLEASNNRFVVIPGFSPDKPAVTKLEQIYFRQSIFAHPFKGEVDHRKLQNVSTKKSLHLAAYIMPSAFAIDPALLKPACRWGTFPPDIVKQLVNTLIDFNTVRPTLDPLYIKELRQLLATL